MRTKLSLYLISIFLFMFHGEVVSENFLMDEAKLKNHIERKNPGFSMYGIKRLEAVSGEADIYAIEEPKKTSERVWRARLFRLVDSGGEKNLSGDDVLYSVAVETLDGNTFDYRDELIYEDTPLPDDSLTRVYDFLIGEKVLDDLAVFHDNEDSLDFSSINFERVVSIGIFRPEINAPDVAYRASLESNLGSLLIYVSFDGGEYKVSNVEVINK